MAESRFVRRSLKQSRKQLYASLAGIAAVLFFAFVLGPTLIGTLGNVIDKITGKSGQQEQIKSDAEIQPPTLEALPNATPSAKIKVSGRSDYPNGRVELFVNGSLSDIKSLDNSQNFEFEDVALSEGDNFIKARIETENKKSNYSEEQKVTYSKSLPKLDISFPQDHQSFSKADQQITVKGVTDPENNVSVNGFIAIVDNNGNFSYNLNLHDGDNKIEISAKNSAGNTTNKAITVSYSP